MPFSKNIVFIAFSDTHGNADRLARLYTLIQETIKRDKQSNPQVRHVLLVPGDVFSVNAVFSVMSKGQFDVEVISAIAKLFDEGHRFFTEGNHDRYYYEAQLINLIESGGFCAVMSNAQFKKESILKYESLATLRVDDQNITIGGLMTPESLNTAGGKASIEAINPCPDHFNQDPPTILMSHLGSKSDRKLPYKVNVLVGGHTHDPFIEEERDAEGKIDRLIVNTGSGECVIVIREGGQHAEMLSVEACAPSPVIQEIVARYEKAYDINLTKAVFQVASASIMPSGLDERAGAKSHLRINDSMITRATVDGIASGLRAQGRHIDIVLYPAAAIRSNFAPDQQVTVQQLFGTYYYANKLVEMTLTGAELISLLAYGVMSGYKCWNNRGQLLVPSDGLTYEFDIDQENPGDTIRWVKMNGKFIDLQAQYVIVSTDWIATDAKKRFPNKEMYFYPEETKIFPLVVEHVQDCILTESFGERIICVQSLDYQQALAKQAGNQRADKPNFDRDKVPINFATHKNNFIAGSVAESVWTRCLNHVRSTLFVKPQAIPSSVDSKETHDVKRQYQLWL